MVTLSLVSSRPADRRGNISNPPADDVDTLVERNCSPSYVEAAMRIRALIEISSLDSQRLLGLANQIESQRRLATPIRLVGD